MRLTILDTVRDPGIINNVKQKTHHLIALRTGHLMDSIFKSMRINRSSYYNSHYFADFSYEYPGDRPQFIRNPKHTPPETGYGDWGTVKLTEPIPISRVSWQYVTGSGRALYNLNDPGAQSSVEPNIQNTALLEIEDDYATLFNNILITCLV